MSRNFDLIYSDRKSVSISVRPDGKVTVRAPSGFPYSEVRKIVDSKEPWIKRAVEKCEAAPGENNSLTKSELEQLKIKTKAIVEPKIKKYAAMLGVSYGTVKIGKAKTRWGSCSSKGNLNFSCLLALVPDRVVDSVVVHELCHRRHMDHSPDFYKTVYSVMPDYDIQDAWLTKNGGKLIAKLYNIEEED